jgi:hypothetical protein
MTARSASAKAQAPDPKTKQPADTGVFRPPVPMKPRKGLFAALMVVFAAWVGVLLALYFTTVRGYRPPAPPSATAPALAASHG